jgi:hypothetical protein|uniref:Uncharacterized protein n=1 Tax=Siphoviridae sp. ctnhN1 TaxID=2827589 RepID=A0A8S5LJY4_9CAUD|nr:MAG TPA: hypothetical protein [Siphoviridae sp. ctnhN1]
MERLTKYLASGAADYNYPAGCYSGNDCNDRVAKSAYRQTCVERLAAYEETGLTPEEVRSLWGEWNAMMRVLNSIGSYDRLRELAEADRNHQIVIRPCKIGDTVWAADTEPVIPLHVMADAVYLEGRHGGDYERLSNFGSVVFLSQEEAKEAASHWLT